MKTIHINEFEDFCEAIIDNRVVKCRYNKNELLTGVPIDNDDIGFLVYEYIPEGTTLYEPLMLIPVDNNRAYTLCHKAVNTRKYKLTQFLKPGLFQDTFDEATESYDMVVQTRYIYNNPAAKETLATVIAALIFIDFVDDDGLVVTINCDHNRVTAPVTYSQNRQSGLSNTNIDDYRDFIYILAKINRFLGHFFDIKIAKTVPSDGAIELNDIKIVVQDDGVKKIEFSDTIDDPSNTFVDETDTTPEVNSYPPE